MDIELLHSVNLMRGMRDEEITQCIESLHGFEKRYQKDEFLLHYGSTTRLIGIILEGNVLIESADAEGSRTIISHFTKGFAFAETYAFFYGVPVSIDAVAASDCRILYLDISSIRTSPMRKESWYQKLMLNMLTIANRKNLTLMERNIHTSPHAIRSRVLSYLDTRRLQTGKDEFNIPYDRQQLADYLNVDRTALSRELSRMKKEGLIDFRKNHFQLHFTASSLSFQSERKE